MKASLDRDIITSISRHAGTEIGRIPDFTFWQDKLWMDIRMEKYI